MVSNVELRTNQSIPYKHKRAKFILKTITAEIRERQFANIFHFVKRETMALRQGDSGFEYASLAIKIKRFNFE